MYYTHPPTPHSKANKNSVLNYWLWRVGEIHQYDGVLIHREVIFHLMKDMGSNLGSRVMYPLTHRSRKITMANSWYLSGRSIMFPPKVELQAQAFNN